MCCLAKGSSPIEAAEFAALLAPLGPFEERPLVACGVSGGRDSMALAFLLKRWVDARGGRLVLLHVDHGLRPESTQEANALGEFFRNVCDYHVLNWVGPKPRTRLQEQARRARYRILSDFCTERGILHLCMAHHAQDQTETVAMRRLRGSTPIGLAGMSARVCRDGVRLLRPLLAQPRSRLEATLTRAGWPTIEDPSNADPRFERARLRHAAENSLPDEASLHAAGLFRREREEAISIAMVQAVKISPLGYAAISAAAAVAPSIALALFSRGARFLNGREYARPPEVFRGVLALSPGQRISLAGCLWQRTKEGWLVASEHAEERSVSGPLLQWNKLFSLEIDAPLPGMVVRGLGPYMSVPRSAHVPYICRRVLPALWRDGVLLAVPHLAPCEGVRVSFQPPRPIIECAFTLALGPKHTM